MLIEVYTEANEPWSAGQRGAFDAAIAEFAGTEVYEDFDADAVLAANIASYEGWGGNVHEDADGPVFSDADAAQQLADIMRRHIRGLGMTVKQFTLNEQ